MDSMLSRNAAGLLTAEELQQYERRSMQVAVTSSKELDACPRLHCPGVAVAPEEAFSSSGEHLNLPCQLQISVKSTEFAMHAFGTCKGNDV